jgi:hypothetical protein
MIDLSFENDDLSLTTNGDIATISDGDQVVSHVLARLRMVLGEDYYDTTKGVPWFTAMYSLATTYDQKAAILRQVIQRTPGVRRIVRFTYGIDPAQRLAVVEYQAETIYSESISDEVYI